MRQNLLSSMFMVVALAGGVFIAINDRPLSLRQRVDSLEAEGFAVEEMGWEAFKESHAPSQDSGLWEGERAYRYEYQETDWGEFVELARGAESLWEQVYGSGHFIVQYDLRAKRVWYLLPFEVNLMTGSIAHYNMVFQWIG